jgi:hypothetical protein
MEQFSAILYQTIDNLKRTYPMGLFLLLFGVGFLIYQAMAWLSGTKNNGRRFRS